MFFILFLLFTALPIFEIYVLVKAGQHIGTLNTIGLVVLSGLLGAWFVKRQTSGLIHKINSNIRNGQMPGDELLAALCVFVGGLLMIAPGFVTDLMGLLLVFPPTRIVLMKFVKIIFMHLSRKGMAHIHVVGFDKMQNNNFRHEERTVYDVGASQIEQESSLSAQERFKDLNT